MVDQAVYQLSDKFNLLMNITEDDKGRFKSIVTWCGSMMELSIKEKVVRTQTIPKRAEIWTADFGENIGSETNKIRPCLVVQDNIANEKAPTVIVIPFTSHTPRFYSHLRIEKEDIINTENAADPPSGTLMVEQVRVISKARMGRKIGEFNDHAMQKVGKVMKVSLGIETI